MKICSKCSLEKKEFEFTASQFKLEFGFCKNCKKEYDKLYYQLNKLEIIDYQKTYYLCNAGKIKTYNKIYRKDNIDRFRLKNNKRAVAYRLSKPEVSLRKDISTLISRQLKLNNSSKNKKSSMMYLLYTIQELRKHLESQFEPWMNWTNYGKYSAKTWTDDDQSTWTWNIDHIIPQSSLPYSSMEDENFKKCWALNNLRPYSAKQNIIEGNKR